MSSNFSLLKRREEICRRKKSLQEEEKILLEANELGTIQETLRWSTKGCQKE